MEKSAKFIIDVSAETKRIFNSSVRFFSKDHRTAKFLIQAEKDKVSIPKDSISRVEILFESVDISYTPTGKVIFNDDMTIEENGLFSYVLPDELLNYSGLMAFEVYIYYVNEDAADSSNRIIYEQRVSAIDRNAGQVELVYIKDMEIAKQAVADKADEVMADMSGYESSLADYEHQIKDGMDLLYDGVANASADEITKIRAELPKVETAANDEITKIQAVLPDVQATAADETARIKAQLPIVEAVAVAEAEKIQSELPKVQSVATDETTKIQSELPHVQTVATVEIGKIHSVLPTVEQTAQEVSDHADQKIAEYDAKFVSTDQKMAELEQSQGELDAELKVTQQQIADADVYTKAEADANAEGVLDKRNLSAAWSWSADGTDRFTTVYPRENLFTMDMIYPTPAAGGVSVAGNIVTYPYGGWGTVFMANPQLKELLKPATTYSVQYVFELLSRTENTTARDQEQHGTLFMYSGVSGYTSFTLGGTSGNVADANTWEVGTTRKREATFTTPATLHDAAANYRLVYYTMMSMKSDGTFAYEKGKFYNVKFEESPSPTIYTPAPSEDPLNAYPKYKGLRLAPSDNAADYDWSYTDEYVDYLKSSSVSKTEFNDLAARLAALENKEV